MTHRRAPDRKGGEKSGSSLAGNQRLLEVPLKESLEDLLSEGSLESRSPLTRSGGNAGPSMDEILASLEELLDEGSQEDLMAPLAPPDNAAESAAWKGESPRSGKKGAAAKSATVSAPPSPVPAPKAAVKAPPVFATREAPGSDAVPPSLDELLAEQSEPLDLSVLEAELQHAVRGFAGMDHPSAPPLPGGGRFPGLTDEPLDLAGWETDDEPLDLSGSEAVLEEDDEPLDLSGSEAVSEEDDEPLDLSGSEAVSEEEEEP
ncbi:MAG: hypothetical protein HQL51_13395, partial [Magnetococcales bacterium]|nr:hypothetical protein [Magnetococcales bacterium]